MFQYVLAPLFVAMVMGEGCCPPDAWEGVAGLMTGWINDSQPHLMKGLLTLHVNITLGKIAMEEELLIDNIKLKLKVIQDYNKKTEYVILNGMCTKKPLESSIPRCIPANATLVDSTYMGAGSEYVAVKIYRFNVRGFETYFTVTAHDCIPVMAVTSGNIPEKKVSGMEVLEYTDITLGIKDPSVFVVPTICQPVDISTGYLPDFGGWRQSVFD